MRRKPGGLAPDPRVDLQDYLNAANKRYSFGGDRGSEPKYTQGVSDALHDKSILSTRKREMRSPGTERRTRCGNSQTSVCGWEKRNASTRTGH